jgi:hypothetical protein
LITLGWSTRAFVYFWAAKLSRTRSSLPAYASKEEAALLRTLESWGCRCNRNGHGRSGEQAVAHLGNKLAQLGRRHLLQTSGGFVHLAVSNSSASGMPYLALRRAAQPVKCKPWLHKRLKALRK